MNLFKKSIKILEKSQLKNGGIIASPKKSAYPYVYPRDAVIITKAFNRVGLTKNSERFYYFMNKFTKIDKYKEVFHRYNMNGWPCVSRKDQNDNEGLVLHGIYDTYLHNKKHVFLEEMWTLVKQIVKLIESYSKSGLVKTKRSVHEFYVLEQGHDIWVNCACCRGIYDAAKIAKILNHEKESKNWEQFAKKLKQNIYKKFYDKKLGVFMKNPRHRGIPDISQIAPFYFKLINSKEKLKKTVDYLTKNLWHKGIGGFRRFRQFEVVEDWHWYTGGSGSWIVFTAIMARFYKKLGNKKSYSGCLDWIEKVAERTHGLLPEHISTRDEYEAWKENEIEFNERLINGAEEAEALAKKFKKEDRNKLIYWATPLGWGHAEYVLLKLI